MRSGEGGGPAPGMSRSRRSNNINVVICYRRRARSWSVGAGCCGGKQATAGNYSQVQPSPLRDLYLTTASSGRLPETAGHERGKDHPRYIEAHRPRIRDADIPRQRLDILAESVHGG